MCKHLNLKYQMHSVLLHPTFCHRYVSVVVPRKAESITEIKYANFSGIMPSLFFWDTTIMSGYAEKISRQSLPVTCRV